MGDCPNEECHERVMGHHRTLYGPDGRSGVAAEVDKKADKKCLNDLSKEVDKKANQECLHKFLKKPPSWVIVLLVTAIIIPLILSINNMRVQQQVDPYVYAKSADVNLNRERVIRVEESTKSMREDICDIKTDVKDIKRLLQRMDRQ